MNTRILLIGASGIVGSELLHTLASTPGFTITATSRNPPAQESRPSVNWLTLDLAQPFDLSSVIKNADWIILNAASKNTGYDLIALEELRAVNIDAVSRIVTAAKGKRLLFLSSLSPIKRPFADPITEQDDCAPTTPYAMSKFWGECVVRQLAHHCILRISSPVPQRWQQLDSTVLRRWLESAMQGGNIEFHGRGEREQDFVSTADIAHACLRVIQTDAHGLYHIASGQPVSMQTLANLIHERFPQSTILQDITRDGNDSERWRVDISRARRMLGYSPKYNAASAIDRMLHSSSS